MTDLSPVYLQNVQLLPHPLTFAHPDLSSPSFLPVLLRSFPHIPPTLEMKKVW